MSDQQLPDATFHVKIFVFNTFYNIRACTYSALYINKSSLKWCFTQMLPQICGTIHLDWHSLPFFRLYFVLKGHYGKLMPSPSLWNLLMGYFERHLKPEMLSAFGPRESAALYLCHYSSVLEPAFYLRSCISPGYLGGDGGSWTWHW